MYPKLMTPVLVVSLLAIGSVLPVFDSTDGAAFAKSEKSDGGGNGNGGNGNGNGDAAKSKKVENGNNASDFGKMNGALNANINAVLAHIRNGQTSKGPIGLLAGLAVADSEAAAAVAAAQALREQAAAFEELDGALAETDYATVEEYLEARANGTATEEERAALDPLIEAVGGTDDTGLALAADRPTDEEIESADAAAAEAEAAVTEVEQSIVDAWNKDGDAEALLAALREKLAPYADKIDAAVAR